MEGSLLLRGLSSRARLGKKKDRVGGVQRAPSPCLIPALQDSIKKFEQELRLERHMKVMEEKQVIVKRQQEEFSRLMQTQVGQLHGRSTDRDGQSGLKGWSGRWPQGRQAPNPCIF